MCEKNSHSSCLSCFPHPFLQPPAHHQLLKGWSQSQGFTLLNESTGTSCGESMLGLLWWIRGGCCRHCWWSECGILPKFSSPSLALKSLSTLRDANELFSFWGLDNPQSQKSEGMMVDEGGASRMRLVPVYTLVSVLLSVFLLACAFFCNITCLSDCLRVCLSDHLSSCLLMCLLSDSLSSSTTNKMWLS